MTDRAHAAGVLIAVMTMLTVGGNASAQVTLDRPRSTLVLADRSARANLR